MQSKIPKELNESIKRLDLPFPLRPYQWDGVLFLLSNENVLLADEMGLGKTVQVSVALDLLYKENELSRALVVVPASLKLNWNEELKRWTNGPSIQLVRGDYEDRQAYYRLPINILIASYEEVRFDIMDFVNEISFDVVVLDEAQRIKNPSSKTALAVKLLTRSKSWSLTGTPVENKLDDLISIFSFVNSGLLNKALSRREIHNRMQPHFLRRRKKEVAKDLPPIIDQDLPLELSGRQLDAYNQLWDQRSKLSEHNSHIHMLAFITRLKQLCNFDPVSEESVKLDVLKSIFDELVNEEDKIIVFSQYVETLNWVSSKIENVPYDIYWGGLNQDARAEKLSTFKKATGPRILFISLQAGGVGLNIQEASTVVLFDRWWNPALENQAIQRAHRFGRKRSLQVIRFLVKNSVEERIFDILYRKQLLFDDYIEGAANADMPDYDINALRNILKI